MKTSSFLSTGKRKKVASRVFGESVFNEADASLCYTPSPGPSIGKAALSARSGITRVEEDCETESPEPIILFHSTEQVHARTLSTSEKQVSFASQKENSSNYCESSIKTKSTLHCPVRKNELNRLRAAKKSPIRSTLVRLTEVAIDKATTSLARTLPTRPASVNEGLNAIRKSKKTILQDKSKATKSVRFKWDQEISQSTFLRDKVEQSQRSIRAIQRQISSAHFRQKAQRDESKKMQLFAELEKEYIFNSEVFRDHKETLKQERDKSRKMSVETREKIRLNNRAGEEKLKMLKLEEERAAFEVRADLHKARVEAAKASAEARRKSFQFRAGDARKIKDMRSKWRDIQLQHDHESYELTRAAAKDVDNHKKQVAEEERDDVRSRNLEARHRRKIEEELSHQAMLAEHESYELKWAGERDAHSYQTKMKEERRKSLASRNKESARHAKVMEELRTLSKEQQAESFILKWAGEDDVKAYKAQLAQNRKKSLQNRAMESRKWRQYEEEEHALNVQKALEEGGIQSACKFLHMNPLILVNLRTMFSHGSNRVVSRRSKGCGEV